MKYLRQFLVILVISFIGEVLKYFIPLPVPASIYGLLILFTALITGVVKIDMVKDTAAFLIEIMPLMFIPAAVGLMDSWNILKPIWIQISVIIIISTVLVMIFSGRVTQFIIRWEKRHLK